MRLVQAWSHSLLVLVGKRGLAPLLLNALFLNAFSASPVIQAAPAIAGKRFALVIGNAGYESVPTLKNARHDAADICSTLTGLGFIVTCRFDVRTRIEFKSIIQDYVDTTADDAVSFIYYAGHAVQVGGRNYLIPTGARVASDSDLATQSVGVDYLMKELRSNPHHLNVVILDACRTNPFGRDADTPHSLAQMTDAPDATIVLYATATDSVALDGAGRNGVMTKNMLAHIREPGTIDDLFKQVSLGVQNDTSVLGRAQRPELYTNFSGQFCLVKCTDLELLQAQKQQLGLTLENLEKRVASGDSDARRLLDATRRENDTLAAEIAKRKERERNEFVPTAF